MSRTRLARVLLGGPTVSWAWGSPEAEESDEAIPAGVVLSHGDHNVLVSWVEGVAEALGVTGGAGRVFTLESVVPLTIAEEIECRCGMSGWIRSGAWVASELGGS